MSENDKSPVDTTEEAPRVIGPLSAFSIVAGSMIGVGIFIFSDEIALGVGTVPLFFGMLLLGGLFAMSGSVACGELGAMIPKAGGDYVFQREAYGRSIAFASGWVLFAAIFAGSTATLAAAVCQYEIGPLLGIDIPTMLTPVLGPFTPAQLGALALVVLFTLINDRGTSLSAGTQTVLTLAPIGLMVLLGLAVLIIQPDVAVPPTGAELAALPEALTLGGLATAFLAVNFIFSGWINIIYVASEVKEPGKNIPRSMISATGVVTLMYVILGAAFVMVLGISGTASSGSPALGFDAGTRLANALGVPWLGPVVLVIITLAILTSINATIMAAARVGYAMASDGAFWAPMSKLSNGVPRRSLWFHAGIACVIVLSGTAETIGEMTSLAMFITGSLTVAAMYVLRVRRPELPRPYRANSWMPALYLVLALFALVAKLIEAVDKPGADAWYPLIGLGILAVTWVGHLVYLRRWKSALLVSVGFLLGGALFDNAAQPPAHAHAAELQPANPSVPPSDVVPTVTP